MKKFIFDLDGTLTACETLPYIAEHFHIARELADLTERTVQGELDFEESFRMRVGLLSSCPIAEVAELLSNVSVFESIRNFIREHKEQCAIASSNLDCWVNPLLLSFGCAFYTSRASIQNNVLQGVEYILEKESIVEKYQKLGCEVIFAGEGNNDLQAMQKAQRKIACALVHNPAKSIAECADYTVYTEKEFLGLLEQIRTE